MAFVIKRVNDESLPVGDNDNGATARTPSTQLMNAVAEATGGRSRMLELFVPRRVVVPDSASLVLLSPGGHRDVMGPQDLGIAPVLAG